MKFEKIEDNNNGFYQYDIRSIANLYLIITQNILLKIEWLLMYYDIAKDRT
jgi:hypothetical protein